jgi:hypothetical protein
VGGLFHRTPPSEQVRSRLRVNRMLVPDSCITALDGVLEPGKVLVGRTLDLEEEGAVDLLNVNSAMPPND